MDATETSSCLLIEESSEMAELLKFYLQRVPHVRVQVDVAPTLHDALQRLGRSRYDLVVADLNLSGPTGFKTIAHLASLAADQSLAVLTETMDPKVEARAYEAGATDYLRKTHVNPTAMRRVVIHALNRQRSSRFGELMDALQDAFRSDMARRNKLHSKPTEHDDPYCRLLLAFQADDPYVDDQRTEVVQRLLEDDLGADDIRALHQRALTRVLQSSQPGTARKLKALHSFVLAEVLAQVTDEHLLQQADATPEGNVDERVAE